MNKTDEHIPPHHLDSDSDMQYGTKRQGCRAVAFPEDWSRIVWSDLASKQSAEILEICTKHAKQALCFDGKLLVPFHVHWCTAHHF
eukprot:s1213_g10.t1